MNDPGPRQQRGWVGMIAILIALVVVAYLSKDALTKYLGASGAATTQKRAGAPAERVDPSSETSAPSAATPIERARGLQDTLQKESEKRGVP